MYHFLEKPPASQSVTVSAERCYCPWEKIERIPKEKRFGLCPENMETYIAKEMSQSFGSVLELETKIIAVV